MDAKSDDRGALEAPNYGLRFLFDEHQARESAAVLLQWCIAPEVIQFLNEKQAENPTLLIVVVNPLGRERRITVALKDMQALVQFHKPGAHRIYGRIFWGLTPREFKESSLMRKEARDVHGVPLDRLLELDSGIGRAEISVEVSAEFFAPEPSAWENWWLNLWHEERWWDECALRRRRIFAYSIQPIVVGAFVLCLTLLRSVMALWYTLCAHREPQWEKVFHPFVYGTKDMHSIHGDWQKKTRHFGSWLRFDSEGNRRWGASVWWFFTPIIPLSIFLVLVGIAALGESINWWRVFTSFLWFMGIGFSLVVVIATMGGAIVGWVERLEENAEEARRRSASRAFAGLTCVGAPAMGLRQLPPSLNYMPRLIYQRVKARVCRPAAA